MNAPLRLLTATAIAACLCLTSAIGWPPTSSHAKDAPPRPQRAVRMAIQYTPPKPPRQLIPSTRRGAASRGCLILAKDWADPDLNNLMALVPETQEQSTATTQVWAQTSVDRPTFWFYIPYATASIETLEFVLNDAQDNTVYKSLVTIPAAPGIVSVQLPASAALQPDQLYNWFFKVKGKQAACTAKTEITTKSDASSGGSDAFNPNQTTDTSQMPVHVEGWIQRVTPNATLTQRLKQLPLQQQAAIYAENGFWYDALTALAQEKLKQPNDASVNADWNALFKQGDLGKLATQRLLQCCHAK